MKTEYSLEYLQNIAKGYDIVPVAKKVLSDIQTPIGVLRLLKSMSDKCFLLESVESAESLGRYSFLGYNPRLELILKNGNLTIKDGGSEKSVATTDPNAEIRKILAQYKSPVLENLPPFTGGLCGYFAYEYAGYYEKLNFANPDEEQMNDMHLMLFDKIIAYDNYRQSIYVIINVKTDNLEQNYNSAVTEIDELINILKTKKAPRETRFSINEFKTEFKCPDYVKVVNKAKHYIVEGDIFQVVASISKRAKAKGSLLEAYRYLRSTNPSPYMFYFNDSDTEIAGASPETLVKKIGTTLTTYPIAGTKPRGKTEQEDMAFASELMADPKEASEHNMLVDLGRNDLGKVSKVGSVKVSKYKQLRRFSHVMHLCSTVESTIDETKDSLDALSAVLPAGTLTGAPKKRACEIIEELEKTRRGVYGGAVGYIDFSGNMDTCIAIRTAVKSGGVVSVRSGGGIVAGSNPKSEFNETVNKAQAVVNACYMAGKKEIK